MRFKKLPAVVSHPTADLHARMRETLRNASCAVIGASAKLRVCQSTKSICTHDIIIRVNHHASMFCNRTDVQIVNAFACLKNTCPVPRLFRLRTEWNPAQQAYFQKDGAWLSNGFVTNYTRHILTSQVATRGCCSTAGGSAVAFALHACRSVAIYGLGNLHHGYLRAPGRLAPHNKYHNLKGENEWYNLLVQKGHIKRRC
jgi:hypothetical protein